MAKKQQKIVPDGPAKRGDIVFTLTGNKRTSLVVDARRGRKGAGVLEYGQRPSKCTVLTMTEDELVEYLSR